MKYFDRVASRKGDKAYDVWIEFDEDGNFIDYNCTCIFGSAYRFSKKAKERNEKCHHFYTSFNKIKDIIKNEKKKMPKL